MSGAVNYIASVSPPAPPAIVIDFTLAAPTASATVIKGSLANYSLSLIPAGASAANVAFSCSGLPEGAACTFNPSSVALGNAPVPISVSISTSDGTHANNHFLTPFAYAITFPVFGMVMAGFLDRRRKSVLVLFAGFSLLLLAGCGVSSSKNLSDNNPTTISASGGTPSGSYTVTITAVAGAVQRSTTVSLTVQ